MSRALSLHPLNALDASPIDLICIAGRLGVHSICLFTYVPPEAGGRYPVVGSAEVAELTRILTEEGVAVGNLEVFPLDRDGALDHLEEGLEIGARLGATRATAHIHQIEGEAQAIDRFARFADQAARHGLIAGLEFNNFSGVRDVGTAERVVRAAGKGALVLDTLHLARGGGDLEDAIRVADITGYVQLSDGPAEIAAENRWREAIHERALPGHGALPLVEIVRAMPADALYEVEAPQAAARKSGVSAEERCRRAVDAARAVIAEAEKGVAR